MSDDYSTDDYELAESARINFENAKVMTPGLSGNPMFTIAMDQLSALCDRLGAADPAA
jgi:hypothetical protein